MSILERTNEAIEEAAKIEDDYIRRVSYHLETDFVVTEVFPPPTEENLKRRDEAVESIAKILVEQIRKGLETGKFIIVDGVITVAKKDEGE